MYLFVRTSTCRPERMADATAFAVDITTRASSLTGLDLAAWQVTFGAPAGTFSWTTTVESHAELGEATEKLAVDVGYLDSVQEAGELFAGPPEDSLIEIVATVGEGGHQGKVADVITARCAPGKISEAMTWGVEMMEYVGNVTGLDGLFTRSLYGPWAAVGWITLAETFEEIDAGTAALNAATDYVPKIDAAGDLFLVDSGQARLSRRIA